MSHLKNQDEHRFSSRSDNKMSTELTELLYYFEPLPDFVRPHSPTTKTTTIVPQPQHQKKGESTTSIMAEKRKW